MATFAARRLSAMNANTASILAIELLAAAEGIEFHRPLQSSLALEKAHALIRAHVPRFNHDRFFAPAITAVRELVETRQFEPLLEGLCLPSQAMQQQ
jgi:histidine ammonia-lyase